MTSSSKKLAKIARKTFRREQSKFLGDALRPKPRWVPWSWWLFGMGIFIKIDK